LKNTVGEAERFSVIVPVYREGQNIEGCLSYLATLPGISKAEVILVDGDSGSTTDVIQTREYPFRLVTLCSPPGRGLQLNRGAQAAKSPRLIFLHVDTLLPKGALKQVGKALSSGEAGAFELGIATRSRLIKMIYSLGALRSRLSRVPFGDQVLFISRKTFLEQGGFMTIPIMEDVDFMRRLKRRGIRIQILNRKVKTSDRRLRREGILRAVLRDLLLYSLYRFGASPGKLAHFYKPNYDRIARIDLSGD
jgi:rSAM/selenodomain-associated transferase 2